jgi:hypothetical protein
MPHEKRVSLVKEIQQKQEDIGMRERIAGHRADLLADREGLAPADERRNTLYQEQKAECDKLTREEVLSESAKLDQWEETGQWLDEAHLRDRLIYTYASQAMAEHRRAQGPEAPYDFSYPSVDQWKQIYSDASAKADAVPTEQRGETLKRLQAKIVEENRRASQMEEEQFVSQQAQEAIAGAVPLFFQSMFSAIDLIFFGLALITAFQVASGSGSNEA